MDIINDFIEIYRSRMEERRRRSEERRVWREHEHNLKKGERRERRMKLMEKILDHAPTIGLFLLCYLFAHFTGLLVTYVYARRLGSLPKFNNFPTTIFPGRKFQFNIFT